MPVLLVLVLVSVYRTLAEYHSWKQQQHLHLIRTCRDQIGQVPRVHFCNYFCPPEQDSAAGLFLLELRFWAQVMMFSMPLLLLYQCTYQLTMYVCMCVSASTSFYLMLKALFLLLFLFLCFYLAYTHMCIAVLSSFFENAIESGVSNLKRAKVEATTIIGTVVVHQWTNEPITKTTNLMVMRLRRREVEGGRTSRSNSQ